ncbi:MAG: hypothetical protein QE267_07340, partial [Akkermansiaceae bacterium]|nr:hypothetical protein [Akkermansiaceae bacterium]
MSCAVVPLHHPHVHFHRKPREKTSSRCAWHGVSHILHRVTAMLTPETPEEQLLGLVKKGSKLMMRKGSHAAAPIKGHGEGEAEKMVVLGLDKWGLVDAVGRLIQTRKGDPRKVALATVIKAHTSVGNEWLAQRLD